MNVSAGILPYVKNFCQEQFAGKTLKPIENEPSKQREQCTQFKTFQWHRLLVIQMKYIELFSKDNKQATYTVNII